jgi:5'-deoxynucleotidase YfbR-like HD superfamily hydrolase
VEIKTILEKLINLQKSYSRTPRTSVTLERYTNFTKLVGKQKLDLKEPLLREPLIEHVGHLPVIASYLYPFVSQRKKIDLGRVLLMLSIHDIGETKTGDVFSHHKTKKQARDEYAIARELTPEYLRNTLDEFEERKTHDAKFAKAVDSIAPILTDLLLDPKVMLKRFKVYSLNSAIAEKGKRQHFSWDKFLNKLFDTLMKELRYREKTGKSFFRPLNNLS